MSQPLRENTTRETDLRTVYGDAYKGRLHVDPKLLDRAYEYKWVCETVLGESQPENITDNLERAWKPVDAQKYPQLVPPTLDNDASTVKLIRRGGQILMMRPKEVGEREKRDFREMNRSIELSVDKDREGDGRNIETTRELSTRVERNGRFADA